MSSNYPVLMASELELDLSQARCCGRDDLDPELFFPYPTELDRIQQAKRVCAGCPIKIPCAKTAYDNVLWGIWGGTTERERSAMRRKAAAERGAA